MRKNQIHKDYHDLSEIMLSTIFNYDEPLTLAKGFKQNKKHGYDYKAFKYVIDLPDQKFQIGFLTSNRIGEIPDLTLYNTDENGGQSLAKVRFLEKSYIPENIFTVLYKFNVYLYSDLYLIVLKNIEDSFLDPQSKDIKRNFLIFPIIYHKENPMMDKNKLKEFVDFKEGNKGILKPFKDFFDEKDRVKNMELFKNYIVTSNYGNLINYQIFDYISKPAETKATEFVNILSKYYDPNRPKSEILDRLNLTEETAENITVDTLLYEYEVKKVDSIFSLRKLDQKYNLNTDKNSAVFMGSYMLHVTNHDYSNSLKIPPESDKNSIFKKKIILISPNVHLVNLDFLLVYPFSASEYKNYCMIPSLFVSIERAITVNEFKLYHEVDIKSKYLLQALSAPGVDIQQNYEVLEVIGDSVLKFIVTGYLYYQNPNDSEHTLTKERKR